MPLPRKTVFLCAGLLMSLSGCFDSGPDCASDATKAFVTKIAKEHPPAQLLAVAMGGSPAEHRLDATRDQCAKIMPEEFGRVAIANNWNLPPDFSSCGGFVMSRNPQARQDCITLRQSVLEKTNACYAPVIEAENNAKAAASYTIDTIRMTAKDATTGKVSCAADLNADLPNDWGGAKESITYTVEKTSDGQLYVTVSGLR